MRREGSPGTAVGRAAHILQPSFGAPRAALSCPGLPRSLPHTRCATGSAPLKRRAAAVKAEPGAVAGAQHRSIANYKAAGVLCYDFTESGELVVLLCQMYGGLPSHPSKKQALVHSAWTVPGGKRRESDEGIESTAARELEEETGGLLPARRVQPLLRYMCWQKSGRYALFFLRLRGWQELPLRYAQMGLPATSASGKPTRDLMWVPVREVEACVRAAGPWARAGVDGQEAGPWKPHPFLTQIFRKSLVRKLRARGRSGWDPVLTADVGGERLPSDVLSVMLRGAPPQQGRAEAVERAPIPGGTPSPPPLEHLVARLRSKALRRTGMAAYSVSTHSKYSCEVCRIRFSRAEDTARHLGSRAHRRMVQGLLMQELLNRLALDEENAGADESAESAVGDLGVAGQVDGGDFVTPDGLRIKRAKSAVEGRLGTERDGSGDSVRRRAEEGTGAGAGPADELPWGECPGVGGGVEGDEWQGALQSPRDLFPVKNLELALEDKAQLHFRNAWSQCSPSLSQLRSPFVNPFTGRLRSHPKYTCDVCGIIFSRASDTAEHLRSDSHRKRVQMLLLEELVRNVGGQVMEEEGASDQHPGGMPIGSSTAEGERDGGGGDGEWASGSQALADPLVSLVFGRRRDVEFVQVDGFLRPSYTLPSPGGSQQGLL